MPNNEYAWGCVVISRYGRKRLLPLFLSAAIAVSTFALFSEQAAAFHTYGGRWGGQPGPGQCCAHVVVNVAQAQQPVNIDGWNNGRAAWNGSSALLYFDAGSSSLYAVDTNNSSTAWDGYTTLQPCASCTYTTAYAYLNYFYTSGYSAGQIQSVAAHELGHAAGLDHENGCVLMTGNTGDRWNNCGVNVPQQDDVNGMNSIY